MTFGSLLILNTLNEVWLIYKRIAGIKARKRLKYKNPVRIWTNKMPWQSSKLCIPKTQIVKVQNGSKNLTKKTLLMAYSAKSSKKVTIYALRALSKVYLRRKFSNTIKIP